MNDAKTPDREETVESFAPAAERRGQYQDVVPPLPPICHCVSCRGSASSVHLR